MPGKDISLLPVLRYHPLDGRCHLPLHIQELLALPGGIVRLHRKHFRGRYMLGCLSLMIHYDHVIGGHLPLHALFPRKAGIICRIYLFHGNVARNLIILLQDLIDILRLLTILHHIIDGHVLLQLPRHLLRIFRQGEEAAGTQIRRRIDFPKEKIGSHHQGNEQSADNAVKRP